MKPLSGRVGPIELEPAIAEKCELHPGGCRNTGAPFVYSARHVIEGEPKRGA